MSGPGYLLDCNTLSAFFNENENVVKNARKAPPEQLGHISVITLGEVEFGLRATQTTNQARRDEYEQFVNSEFLWAVPLDGDAVVIYGEIRAELFRQYGPQQPTSNRNRVEQLCDVNGHSLGIDENDLWLASHAIARGFVLVSNDRMERIRTAAANVGRTLRFENWFDPPSP